MDAMTLSSGLSRPALPMTRADLDAIPDDGYRRELIDGVLVVTPSPSWEHQDVILRLSALLLPLCPQDLTLVVAPYDVHLDDSSSLIPDLLVARRTDMTSRALTSAPLLAVEVLSPTTRRFDLHTKRARYEAAGTPSYWVIDPIELTLTAWELSIPEGAEGEQQYVEVARVGGDEVFSARRPFAVDVVPARLRH